MARPRVFISSTFFDLKDVRADLEKFIRDIGYDPILNERGSIPYGKEAALEEYCYREIDMCDILISIIGGRFGSGSEIEPYSISQMELKHAIETRKQVYIFVERNVLTEYSIYLENKGLKTLKYKYVDNVGVYKFLEEVHSLPKNNPIAPFETSHDITSYLRSQWAGLFQRLLQEQTRKEEVNVVKELKESSVALNNLVKFLTEERKDKDEAIKTILFTSHPAFEAVKTALGIPYRVYFLNREEMVELINARMFQPLAQEEWDSPTHMEWIRKSSGIQYILKVAKSIFDKEGRLIAITKEDWNDRNVELLKTMIKSDDEDDLPF